MPGGRPAKSEQPPLGARIATARGRLGLSQDQLAQKLGASRRVVSYWEREAEGLRADHLAKLAEVLGVTGDWLVGREPDEPRRGTGPEGKLRQVFDQAAELPRDQQKHIIRLVEDAMTAYRARRAG